MFWKGFPDWHEAIEDIIAEGDKVWIRYRVAGTNTGESSYSGITLVPTGKKIAFTAVSIYRIVNGKLVEGWTVSDDLNLLMQLGIIEYTEKGKKLFPAS